MASDAALVRWVEEALAEATALTVGEWMGARRGWTQPEREAAFNRERDALVRAARLQVVRRAKASLGQPVAGVVRAVLLPETHRDAVVGPVLIGMPLNQWMCACAVPRHVRGIARCEWNAEHGWRPRPVDGQG